MIDLLALVDVCNTATEAEDVVGRLRGGGFDMTKVSIVGVNAFGKDEANGCYDLGGGLKHWSETEGFWDRMWKALSGAGAFWLPGSGHVLAAGAVASSIVRVLEHPPAIAGIGPLGASLYRLGVPQNSIASQELALAEGQLLVIAHGTPQDVAKAKSILWTQSVRRI
ncbi:MAG: DUF1269 domain-containing protein [Elusimicrobia bacterium]|nr:DUF1269 domain-containing protein [Elusimicrobiota bacterium]